MCEFQEADPVKLQVPITNRRYPFFYVMRLLSFDKLSREIKALFASSLVLRAAKVRTDRIDHVSDGTNISHAPLALVGTRQPATLRPDLTR